MGNLGVLEQMTANNCGSGVVKVMLVAEEVLV